MILPSGMWFAGSWLKWCLPLGMYGMLTSLCWVSLWHYFQLFSFSCLFQYKCYHDQFLCFLCFEALFSHQSDLFPACVRLECITYLWAYWACLSVYYLGDMVSRFMASTVLHLEWGGLCITWLLSRDFCMHGRVRVFVLWHVLCFVFRGCCGADLHDRFQALTCNRSIITYGWGGRLYISISPTWSLMF